MEDELYRPDGGIGSMVGDDRWTLPTEIEVIDANLSGKDGDDDWLVWRFAPHLSMFNSPELQYVEPHRWLDVAMVEQFRRLHEAPSHAFVDFARTYGLLCICDVHREPGSGSNGHRDRLHVPSIDLIAAGRSGCPPHLWGDWYAEPLSVWRMYSRELDGTLRFVAAANDERMPSRADFDLLRPHSGWDSVLRFAGSPDRDRQHRAIVHSAIMLAVYRWEQAANLRVNVRFDRERQPSLRLVTDGLFSALTAHLLTLVAGARTWATCDGCGAIYWPARRPRKGQRCYCDKPTCKLHANKTRVAAFRQRRQSDEVPYRTSPAQPMARSSIDRSDSHDIARDPQWHGGKG